MGNHQSQDPLMIEQHHHSDQRERRRSVPLPAAVQLLAPEEQKLVLHRTSNGSTRSIDGCRIQGISASPDKLPDCPSATLWKPPRPKRANRKSSSRGSSTVSHWSRNDCSSTEASANDDEASDPCHPSLLVAPNQSLSCAEPRASSVEPALPLQEDQTRQLVASVGSDSLTCTQLQSQQCCARESCAVSEKAAPISGQLDSAETCDVSSLYEFLGIAPDYLDRALTLDVNFDFEASEYLPSHWLPSDSSGRPSCSGDWSSGPPAALANSCTASSCGTAVPFCLSLEDIVGESLSDYEDSEESRRQISSVFIKHTSSAKAMDEAMAAIHCQSKPSSANSSESSSRLCEPALSDQPHTPESCGFGPSNPDQWSALAIGLSTQGASTSFDETNVSAPPASCAHPHDMEVERSELSATDVVARDLLETATNDHGKIDVGEMCCKAADVTSVCLVKGGDDLMTEDINSNKISLVPGDDSVAIVPQSDATHGSFNSDDHLNTNDLCKGNSWASHAVPSRQVETLSLAKCLISASDRCEDDAYPLVANLASETEPSAEPPTEFSMPRAGTASPTCLTPDLSTRGPDSACPHSSTAEQAVWIAGNIQEDEYDKKDNARRSSNEQINIDAQNAGWQIQQDLPTATTIEVLESPCGPEGVVMSTPAAQIESIDEGIIDAPRIAGGNNGGGDDSWSEEVQPVSSSARSTVGLSPTDRDLHLNDGSRSDGGLQGNEPQPNLDLVVGIEASSKQPQEQPADQSVASSGDSTSPWEATAASVAAAATCIAATGSTTVAAITVVQQTSGEQESLAVLPQHGSEPVPSQQIAAAAASGNGGLSVAAAAGAPGMAAVPVLRIRRAIVVQTGGTVFRPASVGGSSPTAAQERPQVQLPPSTRVSPSQPQGGSNGDAYDLSASAPTVTFRQWRKSEGSAGAPSHDGAALMAAPTAGLAPSAARPVGESSKAPGAEDGSARAHQLKTAMMAPEPVADVTSTSTAAEPSATATGGAATATTATTTAAAAAAARPPLLSLSETAVTPQPQASRLRLGAQPFMRSDSLPAFKPLGKLFAPTSPLSPGFQNVPAKIDELAEIMAVGVDSRSGNGSGDGGSSGNSSAGEGRGSADKQAEARQLTADPTSEEDGSICVAIPKEPVECAVTASDVPATAAAATVAIAAAAARVDLECDGRRGADASASSSASAAGLHEDLASARAAATADRLPTTSAAVSSITLMMHSSRDADDAGPRANDEPAADGGCSDQPAGAAQRSNGEAADLSSAYHGCLPEASDEEASGTTGSPPSALQSGQPSTADCSGCSDLGGNGMAADSLAPNERSGGSADGGDRSSVDGGAAVTGAAASAGLVVPSHQRDTTWHGAYVRPVRKASWSVARAYYDDDDGDDGNADNGSSLGEQQQQRRWQPAATAPATDRDGGGEKTKLQGVEKERLDVINSMKVRRKTVDLKQDAAIAEVKEQSSTGRGAERQHTIPNRIRRLSLDGSKNSVPVRSQPAAVVLRKPVSDMVKTLQSSASGDS